MKNILFFILIIVLFGCNKFTKEIPEEYRNELAYNPIIKESVKCRRKMLQSVNFKKTYSDFFVNYQNGDLAALKNQVDSFENELAINILASILVLNDNEDVLNIFIESGIDIFHATDCNGRGANVYTAISFASLDQFNLLLNAYDVELLENMDLIEYAIINCKVDKLKSLIQLGIEENRSLNKKYNLTLEDLSSNFCDVS